MCRFALPILFANLLQSCYNIVDMAVVGRFVGTAGLAGVSSAAMLCYLINALCAGITTGGGVLAAHYKGAGDPRLQEAAGTLFALSALAAGVVTALGLLLCRPVFVLMQAPEEALPHALAYMYPMCLGTVLVFGYNAVCALLRGLGDSRSPLVFVAAATGVNIALDLLLVGALELGTLGASLATVCAQGAAFFIAVPALRRRPDFPFRFRPAQLRPRRAQAVPILKTGLPTAVQMAVLNLSYLLVTGMLNAHGVTVAAAAGIGLKINTFAVLPCWAVGAAVTAMAGQCVGAGDISRAARTGRAGAGLSMLLTLGAVAVVQLFTAPIVGLFDPSPAVVAEGVRYLRLCCSLNCLLYAAMYTYDSFATGVGAAPLAMANSLFHSLAMRLLGSLLLAGPLGLGALGLYWAEALSPIPSAIFGFLFFHSGIWKPKSRP
ncbi:MAG: MATE family efflux transporter [Oscillospiraceae bacterium]|nr:MATE family efflux transporter [Oscillospiraceae bacterium]